MKWLLLVGLCPLGACEKAPPAEAEAASTVDGWHCFGRDANEAIDPQGDVTFSRHRYVAGALDIESINTLAGATTATRVHFTPVGDHLESSVKGIALRVKLLAPDASHWTMTSADPELTFTEESKLEGSVLTVTSVESGVTTTHRFVATSCDNVVAELSKYPVPALAP